MKLLNRFLEYSSEQELFTKDDKILLAVSGGRDSMLMCSLFLSAQLNFEIAHCNFGLRGAESDKDEELVRAYAIQTKAFLHVKTFDTRTYANDHKISIQMAARDLRYTWFNQLAIERNCDYIAIAQHQNDHVETVLLNMTRGTGLHGLCGIKAKRENIIRPLLFLTAREVTSAVEKYAIAYRDDASNFSNKYARNKIRLDIVPQFELLNGNFVETMTENIQHFQESYQLLQEFIAPIREQIFIRESSNRWFIDKRKIADQSLAMLFALFAPYNFAKNVLADMQRSLSGESGRIFESDGYALLLDRAQLILRKHSPPTYTIEVQGHEKVIQWSSFSFSISQSENLAVEPHKNIAQLDYDKLIFPLQIRSWQQGDTFQPLGMKGKKKISDFFIGKKINIFDKKNVPIWVNGNGDILWISNYRIDDRYKITENTQKVLTLVCK